MSQKTSWIPYLQIFGEVLETGREVLHLQSDQNLEQGFQDLLRTRPVSKLVSIKLFVDFIAPVLPWPKEHAQPANSDFLTIVHCALIVSWRNNSKLLPGLSQRLQQDFRSDKFGNLSRRPHCEAHTSWDHHDHTRPVDKPASDVRTPVGRQHRTTSPQTVRNMLKDVKESSSHQDNENPGTNVPLQYFQARSSRGSTFCMVDSLRSSRNCLVHVAVSSSAISAKPSWPTRERVHARPGSEHSESQNPGPVEVVRCLVRDAIDTYHSALELSATQSVDITFMCKDGYLHFANRL